jgi:hypothetical protein
MWKFTATHKAVGLFVFLSSLECKKKEAEKKCFSSLEYHVLKEIIFPFRTTKENNKPN